MTDTFDDSLGRYLVKLYPEYCPSKIGVPRSVAHWVGKNKKFVSRPPMKTRTIPYKVRDPRLGDFLMIWVNEQSNRGHGGGGTGLTGHGIVDTSRRTGDELEITLAGLDLFPEPHLRAHDLKPLARESPILAEINRYRHARMRPILESEWQELLDQANAKTDLVRGASQVQTGSSIRQSSRTDDALVEDLDELRNDDSLAETTRDALIKARLGQGKFRKQLERRWQSVCAVSGCSTGEVLRASHIKPWRDSSKTERLDPENGILLAANIDALFDRGLVTFDDHGRMLISSRVTSVDRRLLGLPLNLRQPLSPKEISFLAVHRAQLFIK